MFLIVSIGTYTFFISNDWVYESTVNEAILKELSPEEREEFDFGVETIDWEDYTRYVLKRFDDANK